MPKKRNGSDIWGENESWGEEDESWEYKSSERASRERGSRFEDDDGFSAPPPPRPSDTKARTASQRREYAERHGNAPRRSPQRDLRERDSRERGLRAPARPPRREPERKSKMVYFYIVTLLIAVAACLLLFAMAFQTITKNNNPVIADAPKESATPAPSASGEMLDRQNTRQFYGLVTAINTASNQITVLDINTNRTSAYEILSSTNIEDRYGTAIAASEIQQGMILDVGYHSQTSALMSLSESTQASKLDYRTNLKIDLETSTVKLGNDSYTYNSQTIVLYKGEPYPISQITEMDTVSLTVYGKNIWCVRLENSHGYLAVENIDKVVSGTLSVGTSVFMSLADMAEPITLAEGTHSVLIEGQNIEPFIQTVSIAPGETNTINLIDVALKPGQLLVNVSEPDSEIIIDGLLITEPGAVELPFGEHTVRVEKEGFLPMEQVVEINTGYRELSIELTKLILNAELTITTIPSPAEVYLDNIFVGYSPWTQDVQVGSHTVTLRLAGYNDATFTFDVVEGKNERSFILWESSSDPFANLPAPEDTEPIVNEMVEDPVYTPAPSALPTPAPNSGQVFEEIFP